MPEKNSMTVCNRNRQRGGAVWEGQVHKRPAKIAPRTATVESENGSLAICARPAEDAPIVCHVSDGERLLVLGGKEGWRRVRRGDDEGYVRSEYITLHYCG